MKRIIGHWSAGSHRASAVDKKHYHFIFEGDGREVQGNWPVSANAGRVSGSAYAAHTRGCNSGSIGLSMACMMGATEKNFGRYPMTEEQFEAMAKKAAELAIRYAIPVTDKTVLSHAEVQKNLGIKQNGKWDFTVLPFRADLKGAKACGDYFRARVQAHIADHYTPKVASLSMVSPEIEAVLDDQDKGVFESSTNVMASVGGLAGIGGLLANVLGVITDPWVQMFLIAVVAAAVFWVLRERSRKARAARKAKETL